MNIVSVIGDLCSLYEAMAEKIEFLTKEVALKDDQIKTMLFERDSNIEERLRVIAERDALKEKCARLDGEISESKEKKETIECQRICR